MRKIWFKGIIIALGMGIPIAGALAESIGVEDTYAPAGPVTIPVVLDISFTTVDTFSFHFHFDETVLEYISCDPGPLLAGFDSFYAGPVVPGEIEISGTDSQGVLPPVAGDIAVVHFNVIDYAQCMLYFSNLESDLLGFEMHPAFFYACTPEWCWLERDLPDACDAGIPFEITYTIQGGTAAIVQVSETVPAGWVVTSPPWDDQTGDTYTWYSQIGSCTVMPAASAAPGSYDFTGSTISDHWCNGEVQMAIAGDTSITLNNPSYTPAPDVPAQGTAGIVLTLFAVSILLLVSFRRR